MLLNTQSWEMEALAAIPPEAVRLTTQELYFCL